MVAGLLLSFVYFVSVAASPEVAPPACYNSSLIKDSDGKTIKMACHVMQYDYSYEKAYQYCEKHGMKLYKFDSIESYNGWHKMATTLFPTNIVAAMWVNGRRDKEYSGDFYIVEDDEKSPILGDVRFVFLTTFGKCFRMIQDANSYVATPWDCNKKMTFFCEFLHE
jgi:hypothetical protein